MHTYYRTFPWLAGDADARELCRSLAQSGALMAPGEVVIVQILIGTEQLTPPHGKAATSLPHGEVGIADHPIDAVIATLQKLAIQKLS